MATLLDEIMEQPDVLQGLLDHEWPRIKQVAERIKAANPKYMVIAARGTSDNAATYAKYLFGAVNGLPVSLATPSLFTLYNQPPRMDGAVVLAVSQAGMSPDIVSVIQEGNKQGLLTIAITNNTDSDLALAANEVLDIRANQETSIAATKSYTASLMVLALLSVALSGSQKDFETLATVPNLVAEVLSSCGTLEQRTERYRYMEQCVVVGRGYNYATTLEMALKLKELNYIGTTPYSSADFRHGPIAVVEEGFPSILIAPHGKVFADMANLADELIARRGELLVLSNDAALLKRADLAIELPAAMPEWISPIVSIVPGQLFARHLAKARKLDTAQPRGLKKVTKTT